MMNDDIVHIQKCSPNAYMAKSDIADYFRLVPMHSQYHLTVFFVGMANITMTDVYLKAVLLLAKYLNKSPLQLSGYLSINLASKT